jgi:hypothetical protein
MVRELYETNAIFSWSNPNCFYEFLAPTIVMDPPNERITDSRLTSQGTMGPIFGQNAVAVVDDDGAKLLDVQ